MFEGERCVHKVTPNIVFQCETMLEEYEEVVEDWYFNHQEERLEKFLCEAHVLKHSESGERNTHTHCV